METMATILGYITGIVGLVCFVLGLIKMFQNGQMVMGIVCIVLLPCCGIGWLVGFVFCWMKASQWNFTNVMWIWSGAFALNLLLGVVNPAPYRQFQEQMKQFQQAK